MAHTIGLVFLASVSTVATAQELPVAEREFITSVVQHVLASEPGGQPVVMVLRTVRWLPAESEPRRRPRDTPPEQWEAPEPIPQGLRDANRGEYEIHGLSLPASITPYLPSDSVHESEEALEALIAEAGESPVILMVSRPYLSEGNGFIAVHRIFADTRCGSFTRYRGTLSDGEWVFRREGTPIIW